MAGKDKLMRGVRVYLGGYDLSGDTRQFSSLDNKCDEVDFTGLSNTVGNVLADRRMLGMRGYQAFMNDASGGASAVLATPPHSLSLAAFIGSAGAAPAVGDLAYLMPSIQLSDMAEFSSKAGLFTSDFLPNAALYDSNYINPWGVVLAPLTSTSSTGSGTTVDNGGATTNGGHGVVVVTASTGGTWALRIQASTTGAFAGEETTLMTFAADGSAIAGEWKSVSGTIPQYLRTRLLRTSGTISLAMAFARN